MVNQVFVLIVIGYSALNSQVVETRELSWHTSLTDCRNVMMAEIQKGRGEFYNENMVCLPVQDAVMASQAREAGRYSYPRRHGTPNVLR